MSAPTCCAFSCRSRKVHRHGLCAKCLHQLEADYGIVVFLALSVNSVIAVANAMSVAPEALVYAPMRGGPNDRFVPKHAVQGGRRCPAEKEAALVKPRRGLRFMWSSGSAHWLCHLTPIDAPAGRLPHSLCGNLPRATKIHTAWRRPAKRRVCLSCKRRARGYWKPKGKVWVPK